MSDDRGASITRTATTRTATERQSPEQRGPGNRGASIGGGRVNGGSPALLRKAAKLRVGMAVMLAGTCREAGCTELRFSRQQPEQVFISLSKKRRITKIVQPGTSAWSIC
ncbi:Uncharacterized protein Fot_30023 [Forsythia ovata]|uniref:Uncharacterized protein n=1 Tax=Forsythia ovata TaxID=205694 RepID=A0ABD1TTJ7_9LAMI